MVQNLGRENWFVTKNYDLDPAIRDCRITANKKCKISPKKGSTLAKISKKPGNFKSAGLHETARLRFDGAEPWERKLVCDKNYDLDRATRDCRITANKKCTISPKKGSTLAKSSKKPGNFRSARLHETARLRIDGSEQGAQPLLVSYTNAE